MNPNENTRCSICGEEIHTWQDYEVSQCKGGGKAFAHTDCIKKRKEREKNERETANRGPGGTHDDLPHL